MIIKSRMIVALGALLLATLISTVIIYNGKHHLSVPKLEDIKTIEVVPGKEFFFDLNNPEHKKIVTNILDWLKSGYLVSDAKDEFRSFGHSPRQIYIEFNNGSEFSIKSAVGSESTKLPDGSIRAWSKNIEGQVTIDMYSNNKNKSVRMVSPELRSFIENGWKEVFKINEQ